MKFKVYVLIVIIIAFASAGCFSKKTEDSSNTEINNQEIKEQQQEPNLHNYLQLTNADALHLYDEYGNSFATYDQLYIEELAKQFSDLELSDAVVNYIYTGVLLLDESSYTFQLYETGVKINDNVYIYTNQDNASKSILVIEELLLTHYWDSIKDVDRIYVNADDIVRTIAVNDSDIPAIIEIIKNSELQREKHDYDPVFPNLSLELSTGAKAQFEIRLINPEILSLTVGGKEYIYTVNDDLWNIIQKQFPIPVYPKNDLYFLFNSTNIVITEESNTLDINNEDRVDITIQGVRDQIVRELLIAIPIDKLEYDVEMQMIFIIEGEEVIVNVNSQGFVYEGIAYRSIDIKDRIVGIINKS